MVAGCLSYVVIAELVVQGHVGQMAGEAPGGGAVQAGGGEGVKAQLGSAGVDVLGNSLQGWRSP